MMRHDGHSLAGVRAQDARGDRLHLWCALLHLFTLPLATAPKDVTFVILVIVAVVRVRVTGRLLGRIMRTPVAWAYIAYVAWYGVAIMWSVDPGDGFDELRAMRFVLLPLVLYPVLDRATWLVAAACLGVATHNLLQVVQWLDVIDGFGPTPGEGRLDGLIHAIQLGAWCCAAMVWHLSAAMNGRGWARWGSLMLLVVAGLGMIATGSRGPWIAAAVAMPLCFLWIMWRRRAARTFGLVMLALGVVAGAVVMLSPVGQRMIVPRIERAVEQVTAAQEEQVYWTSAGLRIGLWSWAWEMYTRKPIAGHGPGSYQETLFEIEEYSAIYDANKDRGSREKYLTRDHAHSDYLHTLAMTGTVGGVLLAALLGLTLWNSVLRAMRQSDLYGDALPFVLMAWMVGAQFECYLLNGHTAGLLALIVALGMRVCSSDDDRGCGTMRR